MKKIKRFILSLFIVVLIFILTGCISFLTGFMNASAPTPRIDITRLDHNNYKYFNYNGRSVKGIFAGYATNCFYLEDRVNAQKQKAIQMNNSQRMKTPSTASVGSGLKDSYKSGKAGRWYNPNKIDTSKMPDYLRFVVHASSAKLNYETSYRDWVTERNEQNNRANPNTIVNLCHQEINKHPYSSSSKFPGCVVVCEISRNKNGKSYWWDDNKLYFLQKIYVLDFNAQ